MPTGVGIVVAGDPRVMFRQIEDLADDAYDTLLANGVPAERIALSSFRIWSDVDNGRATHEASTAAEKRYLERGLPGLVGVTNLVSGTVASLRNRWGQDTTNTDEFVLDRRSSLASSDLDDDLDD